jgi:hypothetical protein
MLQKNAELSKELVCVKMRSGIEIWTEKTKSEELGKILESLTQSTFLQFEGEILNSADIEGIYPATTMEIFTRHKNGEHKCKFGNWHERGERCECEETPLPRQFFLKNEDRYKEARANCPRKCDKGYWYPNPDDTRTSRRCECMKDLDEEMSAWVKEHSPS